MSKLFQAANNYTTTTNGACAYRSTLSACLDLFFHAPAMRGRDISVLFRNAYEEDQDVAVRILQWLRDVRGGAGVRQLFLDTVRSGVINRETTAKLIKKMPEIGRYKDLLVFANTGYEDVAFGVIAAALNDKATVGLAAKWMPRQGEVANRLRKYLGFATPKQYRKFLVEHTDVVEQKICAGEWDKIEFDKLPSMAAKRYQSLFNKHAAEQYAAYKASLEVGEAKVNASTLYPHDVVTACMRGDAAVANAQWNALPNYMEGSDESILCVVDVSGSMGVPAGRSHLSTVSCMDVAVALGLYISERTEGLFHNQFITFSQTPVFHTIQGNSIRERVTNVKRAQWGYNTNLEAVFRMVLKAAVDHKIPESEMPDKILILSDMQFDAANRGNTVNETMFENIDRQYATAGYKRPQIVFWNINSEGTSVPVTATTGGTALVSGFSPSVLKGLLSGELDPIKVMMALVGGDRYKL